MLRGAQTVGGNKRRETLLNSGAHHGASQRNAFTLPLSLLILVSQKLCGLFSLPAPVLCLLLTRGRAWLLSLNSYTTTTTHVDHCLYSWTLTVSSREGICQTVFCLDFHVLSGQYG